MSKKILIVCTGNSCRSQMAEAFLKSFDPQLEVFSAGTNPASILNPNTIKVMEEAGINMSSQYPKNIIKFVENTFDYVVTVCDNAINSCPVFTGKVKHRIHLGFIDPAEANGSKEKILNEYREVRDEIRNSFLHLYNTKLKTN